MKFLNNILAQAGLIVSGTTNLNGSSTAVTVATNDNSTNIATTAFVKNNGYLTGISSANVTTALGYTPYNSTNPNGYITGINSSMVTAALGYTPLSGSGTTGYLAKWDNGALTNSLICDNASAIGINTASPFSSPSFKLDINGGVLIKNASGVSAQLVLINSDPASGGNNGFVQLLAGGNTSTAYGQWQTYYGASIASGTLIMQALGGTVLVGSSTAVTGGGVLQVAGDVNISGFFKVNGVAFSGGASTLSSLTDATIATPSSSQLLQYNGTKWVNWSPNYLTTITSSNVTTALGFTPYNSSNPSGFITNSALNSYLLLSGGTMANTATLSIGDADNLDRTNGVSRTRLQLAPPSHTGAEWTFVTYDDSSNAYIRIGYGDGAASLQMRHDGYTTIGGNALITSGNIGSQSVNYASSAGSANSVAWGNVSGRPTAVSSFSNDSGYITSSALSSYLPLSGGTLTGTVVAPNFTLSSGANFFYAANATYNYKAVFISNWSGAGIWGLGATSGHTLKFDQISGTNDWANATDLELYLGTKQVIHSANIGSQSVSYASSAGSANSVAWGNVSGRPTALSSFTNDLGNYGGWLTSGTGVTTTYNTSLNSDSRNSRGVTRLYRNESDSDYSVQTAWSIDVSGYWSLRGYSGDSFHAHCWVNRSGYADSAGSSSISSQVTVNYNNDSSSTYQMLWGSGNSVYGTAGVYVNPNIDTIYAGAYRGSGNVGGTGEASWHPAGIYSGSTQWLYGTTYRNNAATYGQGNMYFDGNYGYGMIGLYNSTIFQGIFAMGDAYKLTAGGGMNNLYGLTWSHPNAGGQAGYLNDHGLIVAVNGLTYSAISSNIWARGTITANGSAYANGNRLVENSGTWNINVTGSAGSAGSVAWGNVSGQPSNLTYWNTWYGSAYLGSDGNLYMGWAGAWLSSWFNQDVRTSAYVNFYNITISTSGTASDWYANGWFRNNAQNCGLYSQVNGTHFYSSGSSSWNITGSGGNIELVFRSNHQSTIRGYVYADTSNQIGFLNSGGSWSLRMDNSGNLTATGDVTAYSDSRVKENVVTVDNALSKVLSLRGVYYNRIDTDDRKRKIGVIAQETLSVIPEVVNNDDKGMYNVAYGNLGGLFIEAFKEHDKTIKEQAEQIKELKSIINVLTK